MTVEVKSRAERRALLGDGGQPPLLQIPLVSAYGMDICCVEIDPNVTVGALKSKIQTVVGMRSSCQFLTANGAEMEKGHLVARYILGSTDVVTLSYAGERRK